MRCESCRHDNDDTTKFCTNCGAALGGRRCAKGHTIPDGLTDCPFCPRPVRVATALETPPPEVAHAPRRQGTALVSPTDLERSGVQLNPNAAAAPKAPVAPAYGAQAYGAPPASPAAAPPASSRGRTVFRAPDAPPESTIAPAPAAPAAPAAGSKPSGQSAFPSPLVGFLVSFSVDPNGQHWPVRYGRTSIGSEAGCEIMLAAPGVSSRHAEVMVRDNRGAPKIWVSDNNSTNGTQLNGADIFTERPDLSHGDQIAIAGVEFLFVALPSSGQA